MRVRDHVAISAAGAALLRAWIGRGGLGLFAGGVLIDADHYAWFCVREHRLNPLAAVRFFNEADPPQHTASRLLHSPVALLTVLIIGLRHRPLLPVALGMASHVVLDAYHQARMAEARAAALRRDEFSCRGCRVSAPDVATHTSRQPWLLPSYRPQNLVSLCAQCHEAAHRRGRRPVRER